MTSPSPFIRQLHKLDGKRLQRTCASQLRDDGWEKDGAFLFFFCSSHRVTCNVSEISWRHLDCVDTWCRHISTNLSRRERPVTCLYWGKKKHSAKYTKTKQLDNIRLINQVLIMSVFSDSYQQVSICHFKENLGLDLAKHFSSLDDILAQAVSCSNTPWPPTQHYQPQYSHSAKVTSSHTSLISSLNQGIKGSSDTDTYSILRWL